MLLKLGVGVIVIFSFLTVGAYNLEDDDGESSAIFAAIGVVFLLILGIVFLTLNSSVKNERVFENQIIMYEEENQKIETELNAIVNAYILVENDLYKDFKNDKALIQLIPELKSNILVIQYMETLKENSTEIKKLKTKKIEVQRNYYWVYWSVKL